MALRGLWGSHFSYKGGRPGRGLPRRLWFKVALSVGAAVPPESANMAGLEKAVLELRGEWR